MSSAPIIDWLYATPVSTAIRDMLWVVPTVQSIHIVAIAVIFGSAVISDLRLAGVFATDEPMRGVIRRYYPWMRNALVVLLLTGLVMTIGEPDRVLVNSTFWLKMALVVSAFTLAWWVRRPLLRPADPARSEGTDGLVKTLAWLSIALWCVVIFCGRWIAYTI
ncbi:hypothetical protein E3Z27_14620 [Pseudomonas mediterranea]|uniref:Copper resistance protein D n=1 Tax=Pseudomonas mediterranea TaxID=183795 RepID=A0AAX2DDF6_9PSED|nr:DUF6644 family protein [Pseudomonas mediterranea]KGU83219.1 membrane protein [Pseudomonas mediterranea CFBP 5447]MBL0841632.1 CopD family protein [Pseudomonas mediterranea]MDU9030189.1 DUF6644 family protein [Pseudomonas mediterranea]QHA82822.1 hypothetical protein E3Z27_14620 [Pseudomonas mediterranea]CAH0146207.1 hypothetical protein SRABI112_00572 [Pseudomonas mediterranea]